MSSVAEREKPRTDVKYWAKRPFKYGRRGNEINLGRGQVFKLQDLENDALLLSLGYIGEVVDKQTVYPCRECGGYFIDQTMRDAHGRLEHEAGEFKPPPPPQRMEGESEAAYALRLDEWSAAAGRMHDKQKETRQKRIDEEAPINYENTKATREA